MYVQVMDMHASKLNYMFKCIGNTNHNVVHDMETF